MDPHFQVPELMALDREIEDASEKLKGLSENSHHAITRLEDEHIQLREEYLDESKRMQTKQLNELKDHLDPYFGEEKDEAPESLSEEEQCEYRRRRLYRLGANSMLRIFDLKHKQDGEEHLKKIKDIVSHNINTDFETADDLQVLMCVNFALVRFSSVYLREIVFEDMVKMSQRLYERRGTRKFIHLEPYLFYVMFNWPPAENAKIYHASANEHTVKTGRPKTRPINHTMFVGALTKWKEAYYAKYPTQGKPYHKKDTTIFFFANGTDMGSIVSQASLLVQGLDAKGESFWKQPQVQRSLKRFQGILISDGDEVELTMVYASGNKDKITIPTSICVSDRRIWNKKVYFVIGFSWKGPKAFDVSAEDPTADPAFLATDSVRDYDSDVRARDLRHLTSDDGEGIEPHLVYAEKLRFCTEKLDDIADLKLKEQAGHRLNPSEVWFSTVVVI